MFLVMILVRKAKSKSTSPLRHIASYDRSNVRRDGSKKDQAKEKKKISKNHEPCGTTFEMYPFF